MYVEGCGSRRPRRLSEVPCGRDPISRSSSGSAINHDGRSSGLQCRITWPRKRSSVFGSRQCGPGQRTSIMSRPTARGTPFGDPIEVQALGASLGMGPHRGDSPDGGRGEDQHRASGRAAAGVTGLIKVVLALQHRQIPHLHSQRPNTFVSWKGPPITRSSPPCVRVARNAARPLRAGVSSFGFSGTNAA